jgi:hypothetical protein
MNSWRDKQTKMIKLLNMLIVVTCRLVAGKWPRDKQIDLFPRKRLNYNNEERCFISGPYSVVISGRSWELQLVSQ